MVCVFIFMFRYIGFDLEAHAEYDPTLKFMDPSSRTSTLHWEILR